MQIIVTPHQIFKLHISIIFFLACMHALISIIFIAFDIDNLKGIAHLFRMDFENNIPTLFSGFALLLSSFLSLAIFQQAEKKTSVDFGWLIVSLVLAFLCIDETLQVHEKFSLVGRSLLGWEEESRRSAWFVVYAPLPFLVATLLWKWFWNLPRLTQIGFLVSGLIFLAATVGMEIIQVIGNKGLVPYEANKQIWFQASVIVEESLEMFAVALALRTILHFTCENLGGLLIGENPKCQTVR